MTTDPTRAAEIVVEQRHIDAAQDIYDTVPLFAMGHVKARPSHALVQAFARFERDHMQRPTDTARAGEGELQAWQHFPGTEINKAPAGWDGRAVLCSDGKIYLIPPGWSWCKVGDLPFVVAYTITVAALASIPQPAAAETLDERAVMSCPQCEGEGGYPDGVDEAACHTDCTRCDGNGWIVDLAAIRQSAKGGE